MNTRKQKFLDIYPKAYCNVLKTCEQVGISRTAFYKWLANDSDFKKEVKKIDAQKDELLNQRVPKPFQKWNQALKSVVQRGLGVDEGRFLGREIPFESKLKTLQGSLKRKQADESGGHTYLDVDYITFKRIDWGKKFYRTREALHKEQEYFETHLFEKSLKGLKRQLNRKERYL